MCFYKTTIFSYDFDFLKLLYIFIAPKSTLPFCLLGKAYANVCHYIIAEAMLQSKGLLFKYPNHLSLFFQLLGALSCRGTEGLEASLHRGVQVGQGESSFIWLQATVFNVKH